jgi:FkbM family methyltransferase
MNLFKKIIRCAFNKCGFDIKIKEQWDSYSWLANEGIKTVLDIGANTGQFALRIHKLLPDVEVYSFEPLVSCFEELKRNMKDVPKSRCFNYALGNENGKHTIYHNEFSDSSSLLPMEQLHKDAFPFAKNAREEMIEVRRLDDVVDLLELTEKILIKIDVQGFEDKVIAGGQNTMRKAKILIVETCFEPLYIGQLLFDDIYSLINDMGFTYRGAEESFRNPLNGKILYCDSVFVKS